MGKNEYFQYYVEGDNEKKLLSVLKTDLGLIVSGKIEKLNVVQEKLTPIRLMQLKKDTTVILVFDTDAGNINILNENINILKKCTFVKQIICVPQVKNLEDELIRSCDINQIKELLGSKSNKDYKHDLVVEKNLKEKLILHKFDIDKFWNQLPTGMYHSIKNESRKVKILK